jgi:YkoY family integral membrane protein
VHIQIADFVTIGLLIVLEGLLSADNALVMAVMVLGLPKRQHHKALHYGLLGGFALRVAATLLAVYLIQVSWIKLIGGFYLLYLTFTHFWGHEDPGQRRRPPKARPLLGLTAFWGTVVRVELVNLAFSIDSILVAVAMSPKRWVVLTGGLLGIVALRLVVGQLISLVQRYPTLVDGAFIIIAWVGVKLALEYLFAAGVVHFEVPRAFSLGLIITIFVIALIYARREGAVTVLDDPIAEKATELIAEGSGPDSARPVT